VVTMVSAHPGGEMPEDAHRDQPGPYSQADLLDAQNSLGGDKAPPKLAGDVYIVTE